METKTPPPPHQLIHGQPPIDCDIDKHTGLHGLHTPLSCAFQKALFHSLLLWKKKKCAIHKALQDGFKDIIMHVETEKDSCYDK